MEHHFDVDLAKQHGVNAAIFLNNIAFWIQKNVANKRHLKDGSFWTYNSQEAFTKLFPYWSRQNIRTIINYCLKNDLIVLGNFNDKSYDKTTWYSLTDKSLLFFPQLKELISETLGWNQPKDRLESTKPLVRTNQPIPDNKPDNKPNSAPASVDNSGENTKKSGTLCLLPYDFFPNEACLKALNEHAVRCGMTTHELFDKFFKVHRDKHETKSKNWQKKFIQFLESELPKRKYEDKTGKQRRYDDKPLY